MIGESLMEQVASFGIAGLLFVMWWQERRERQQITAAVPDAMSYAKQLANVNEQLLNVVRANTQVLAELREELRASRAAEREWLARLSQQLAEVRGVVGDAAELDETETE